MRVVLSIGGSVLAPDLATTRLRDHARVIDTLVDDGVTVGAVVGGGAVAREYIEAARELGANEMVLDQLGIAVTRLNARLLSTALGDRAGRTPPVDYAAAGEALRHDPVTVMGGVAPAQTTDAVSAALAEYVDADLLVYATSVSGVYSADPNEVPDATKYDRLTGAELLDVVVDLEMTAGAAAPVDLLAAKIIQRSGIRTIVLDGTAPEQIGRAVRTGEHEGTDVIPAAGGTDPTAWSSDDG